MRVRVRRIAKWGCLSLGSVMLVAAVVGHWWSFSYVARFRPGSEPWLVDVLLSNDEMWVHWEHPDTVLEKQGIPVNRMAPGWRFAARQPVPPSAPQARRLAYWVLVGWAGHVSLPTSLVAVPILGTGVILWRLDRRRAAHECPKCRYDRRGLAAGAVCPECGAG